jgi:eukaryotic-like serine/threonine-protein kinase
VRLADFGQAMTVSKRTAANFTGTPIFMAPERFTHDNFCPHASDMWAVGVTFYVALCGDYPFKGVTLSAFRQEIAEKDVTYPSWLNPKLKEML